MQALNVGGEGGRKGERSTRPKSRSRMFGAPAFTEHICMYVCVCTQQHMYKCIHINIYYMLAYMIYVPYIYIYKLYIYVGIYLYVSCKSMCCLFAYYLQLAFLVLLSPIFLEYQLHSGLLIDIELAHMHTYTFIHKYIWLCIIYE